MIDKKYLENKKEELLNELEKINNGEIYCNIQEKVDAFRSEKMALLEDEVNEYEKSLKEDIDKNYDKSKIEHYIELCDELLKAFDNEEIVEENNDIENNNEEIVEEVVEETMPMDTEKPEVIKEPTSLNNGKNEQPKPTAFMFLKQH